MNIFTAPIVIYRGTSYDKCSYCKWLWIKASAKRPSCKMYCKWFIPLPVPQRCTPAPGGLAGCSRTLRASTPGGARQAGPCSSQIYRRHNCPADRRASATTGNTQRERERREERGERREERERERRERERERHTERGERDTEGETVSGVFMLWNRLHLHIKRNLSLYVVWRTELWYGKNTRWYSVLYTHKKVFPSNKRQGPASLSV